MKDLIPKLDYIVQASNLRGDLISTIALIVDSRTGTALLNHMDPKGNQLILPSAPVLIFVDSSLPYDCVAVTKIFPCSAVSLKEIPTAWHNN